MEKVTPYTLQEWHKNLVDDKSVKVGGKQCITTLDGYAFPLKCTGGLMYLNIMGKPTDEELVKYLPQTYQKKSTGPVRFL